MKKYRMKRILSLLMVLTLAFGMMCVPVSSYTNDVRTSTNDMILVNVDTNTVVFSQKPDNKWFSGYLVALTTYLVACDSIASPEKTSFTVTREYIDQIPYSDGCLNAYIGKKITCKDLMAIALLTTGSDASIALADLSGMALDEFVTAMNEKVESLGCTGTHFVSPGYSSDRTQNTTCRDLYRIYMAVRDTKLFSELTKDKRYVPDGLDPEKYTVESNASILNSNSPYYFRYTNDAKFSYTDETYQNIALTTTYKGKTYFFAGLLGYNRSEENVYADARKLTTWAYLNLSDRKVIDSESEISPVKIVSSWGEYEMKLFPFNSSYKTLPNDFDESMLSYSINMKTKYNWPLFKGQKIGDAKITYDKEQIEDVNLVLESSEGVDMLSDSAQFGKYVFDRLLSDNPLIVSSKHLSEKEEPSKATTEPSVSGTAASQTAATEAAAEAAQE